MISEDKKASKIICLLNIYIYINLYKKGRDNNMNERSINTYKSRLSMSENKIKLLYKILILLTWSLKIYNVSLKTSQWELYGTFPKNQAVSYLERKKKKDAKC